jgi:cytochrome c biogenesis protein CcdA/thiol-disulfide isomerase/thioredoxin
MFSLAFVSFIAGILTILAPCVLPVLPVILAGSIGEKGKWYPYIVTFSLAFSIVFFTVFLKASTLLIDVPPDFWKYLSGIILLVLGLVYIFPHVWTRLSFMVFGSTANKTLDQAQNIESSTTRAIVTGAVLGPVFSTCSPTYSLLLATVFPVSFFSGIFYTIIYALGLSVILLLISKFGSKLIQKLKIYADEKWIFRKVLWIILVIVGFLIVSGIDKKIETALIEVFDVSRIEQSILDTFIPVNNWVKTSEIPLNGETGTLAPEFPQGLTEWINSNPLTMKWLRWKVVLIDFWTYSCINCQRTLPYLTDWDKKYRDQGLVIIGVHAPEFAFEKNKNNVEKAVKDAKINYPVVLDNDFTLWNLYSNRYWPAKYFIDREGRIRHTHFWEGEYIESEKVIQQLLSEWQKNPISIPIEVKPIESVWTQNITPETYLGTERREHYKIFPSEMTTNDWTLEKWTSALSTEKLSDYWQENQESITSKKSGWFLTLNYQAKDVYLVLSGSGKINVFTTDKSGKNFVDDAPGGVLTVDGDRMYHIIHESNSTVGSIFLEFSSWISAYAFTFGS